MVQTYSVWSAFHLRSSGTSRLGGSGRETGLAHSKAAGRNLAARHRNQYETAESTRAGKVSPKENCSVEVWASKKITGAREQRVPRPCPADFGRDRAGNLTSGLEGLAPNRVANGRM